MNEEGETTTPLELPYLSEPYETMEMNSLELPLLNLMRQLEPALAGGSYDLLIGDDTSARLPALVVKKVIDYQSRTLNRRKVPLFFIQSGRYMKDEEIAKQVEELTRVHPNLSPQKRALVLTEYIRSGDSLKRLGQNLRASGINYDVAILTSWKDEQFYRKNGTLEADTQLFVAGPDFNKDAQAIPLIWQNREQIGVGVGSDERGTVKRSLDRGSESRTTIAGVRVRSEDKDRIQAARRDVHRVAARIIHGLTQGVSLRTA